MRKNLFSRTDDLQRLLERVRAREEAATLLLESQVAGRMAAVLQANRRDGHPPVGDLARELVPVLASGERSGNPIVSIWNTLDEIAGLPEGAMSQREWVESAGSIVHGERGELPSRERRQLARALEESFRELRKRDAAGHARLARLLRGEIRPALMRRGRETTEGERHGRRGVLAATEPVRECGAWLTRDHARELLRWRDILASLFPSECRPRRRLAVPGGVACTDLEGPCLSWQAISGTLDPQDEIAFEGHLLCCDACFEFHYRARWALEVLREEIDAFAPIEMDGSEAGGAMERGLGGWLGCRLRRFVRWSFGD